MYEFIRAYPDVRDSPRIDESQMASSKFSILKNKINLIFLQVVRVARGVGEREEKNIILNIYPTLQGDHPRLSSLDFKGKLSKIFPICTFFQFFQ